MRIGVSEKFSAAHSIPGHEKCGRVHGHNFRVEIEIEGDVRENGMVMDFFDLKKHLKEVLVEFDHRLLNEIIDIPTSENLCLEIMRRLKERGIDVVRVRVYDNDDKLAEIRK